MVSIVWGVIAFSLGLLTFLLVPMLAAGAHVEWRLKIGRWFTDLMMKSMRQLAFVQRVFGGFDLLPMRINDDRKMGEVTVSSGVVSDDKVVPFRDPGGRIKRLQGKPACMILQDIPAAISPELAEMGHWLREHDGGVHQESCEACDGTGTVSDGACRPCGGTGSQTVVDPYPEVSDEMRVANPRDALALLGCSVEPETITTAETLTKKRFAEYAGNIGAVEVGATFVSFGVGAGVVAGLQYLNQEVLDSGGGGGPPTTDPVPIMLDTTMTILQPAADLAVVLL